MYLENRLIAMLDVLGLANRIQTREGLERTTAKYAELIGRARGHMFSPKGMPGSPKEPKPNFEYGQFVFDTVVLVSYPVDVKSAYRFVFATILLMEIFFAERFPLRGSIGKGDFCVDEPVPIFLSDAFKRLRADEENQHWTGCSLLPEAEEIVLSSVLGTAVPNDLPQSSPLHKMAIPVKKQKVQPQLRWCLNWSHFLSPTIIETGLEYMAGDLPKQENTRKYLNSLRELKDDTQILTPEFFPAKRLKVMKARSGMRTKFEDDDGNGVTPSCSFTIAAFESNA
jgi:hypothetical protein